MSTTQSKSEVAPAQLGHTPGPFKNNGLYITQASSGRILATIERDRSRPKDVEGNLALFTAAPALLAACKRASEVLQTCIQPDQSLR
jgi:hypothetical protein